MYSGPSPRNLVISVLLHGSAIAGLLNLSRPLDAPPDVLVGDGRPTEIRIRGKLYYVAQLDGSQSGSSSAQAAPSQKNKGRNGGIGALRAAAAGRLPKPARAAITTPSEEKARVSASTASAAPAATPAPDPLPEKIRSLRQEARAFVPPEVHPTPGATQTLIQPLSPDVAPPPTPLPNFRVFTDLRQVRKIPKPFQAPGRRTPPTPAQAADLAQPALDLVPQPPAPLGDPLTVLSMNDHPIPFNEKVVVPPGNIAPPPAPSNGPASASGGASGTARDVVSGPPSTGSSAGSTSGVAAASGGSSSAPGSGTATNGGAAKGGSATGAGSALSGATPGNGRGAVGDGTGSALTGGSREGNLAAIVGGNGASPGSTEAGVGVKGPGINGPGPGGSAPGGSGSAGTGVSSGAGAGTGPGTGPGTGRGIAGAPTINRPPSGTFDAVVVQSSPVDQYPESRGMLSGRPIYSVYISMGTARDWTLFFCVPGEKPESTNGPVVVLGPMGAPVKAPFPTKLVKPAITLPSYEKYVLVHGTVNKDGKFESLRLVRSIKPETDQAVLAALGSWEFSAATRDGVAIAVEFLLSIPAKGL